MALPIFKVYIFQKRTFHIGQPAKVELVSVDLRLRRLDFSLVEEGEWKKGKQRKGTGRARTKGSGRAKGSGRGRGKAKAKGAAKGEARGKSKGEARAKGKGKGAAPRSRRRKP